MKKIKAFFSKLKSIFVDLYSTTNGRLLSSVIIGIILGTCSTYGPVGKLYFKNGPPILWVASIVLIAGPVLYIIVRAFINSSKGK